MLWTTHDDRFAARCIFLSDWTRRKIKREQEDTDAAGRGRPFSQPRIVVDQPIEGALHRGKRRRSLRYLAKRH